MPKLFMYCDIHPQFFKIILTTNFITMLYSVKLGF
jgi:hypothetical protein